MKLLIGTVATLSGVLFVLSLASANPALLPKHPGYPAKPATSPVTGQPLANDPGQTNASGEKAELEAAQSVKHAQQHLMDQNNQRIMKKEGAGRLPAVQGPQIKIEPPVQSATKIGAGRQIP
ncbi:MAG: hypothetical protein AB1555_02290 [Nitrospirota bacterium]